MIDFEQPKPLHDSLSMAPLIDIIFLLLLFFLLTSVFIEPGIPLNLPESATAEFQENAPEQVIYISKLGEIYMNERFVPFDALQPELTAALNRRQSKQVTLKADKEVEFGMFVRVMDIVKAGGGEDIIISAEFPR